VNPVSVTVTFVMLPVAPDRTTDDPYGVALPDVGIEINVVFDPLTLTLPTAVRLPVV
jgi:hypothetical protein